uniref:chromate transporter n=1 Tax=Oscillatoria sp. FACHB-1407 TaxID=2692847 RepID=UPI0030D7BE80
MVKHYQWLDAQQFLDAVAVAMITPGPVVITTGFIGFLVAGFSGACIAALGTFIPCYLLTIIPAPYFKKHGKKPAIAAFVNGVTVARLTKLRSWKAAEDGKFTLKGIILLLLGCNGRLRVRQA